MDKDLTSDEVKVLELAFNYGCVVTSHNYLYSGYNVREAVAGGLVRKGYLLDGKLMRGVSGLEYRLADYWKLSKAQERWLRVAADGKVVEVCKPSCKVLLRLGLVVVVSGSDVVVASQAGKNWLMVRDLRNELIASRSKK